jgi:hypothetical protein
VLIPSEAYTQHKVKMNIGGIKIDAQEKRIQWSQLREFGLQLATPEQVEQFKRVYVTALGFDVIAYFNDRDMPTNPHGCDCDQNEEVTDDTAFTPIA